MGLKSKQNSALAIEWRALDSIRPYPKNARKISQKAIDAVARSIAEFGWRQPIVVDTEGIIVIGHVRRLAAIQMTLLEVPVHVCDLPPAKIRALRLMDNRSHDEAQWDMEVLTAEMLELRGLDLDLSMTGFASRELDALLRLDRPDEDDVPPVPESPVTRAGDLWLMGEHRLLCGNATSAADVARVMNGEKPKMLWTDPPYGVDYGSLVASRKNQKKGGWEDIEGDALSDDALAHLLTNSLLADGATIAFVWHPAGARRFLFWQALESNGWRPAQEVVWVKNALVFGRADYQWRHEPCIYARRGAAERQMDRTETTVWEVNKPTISDHPTQKPVELCSRPIRNHTAPGDIVFDPFLGSGTCSIACEGLSRVCRGLEISPPYCDVIVQRWQKFTGREATLDGHGATFAHVKDGRLREWEDSIKEEILGR